MTRADVRSLDVPVYRKPPEYRFFAPGFLRLGGWHMGYTENSSFRYSAFPDCVLEGIVARAIRLFEQEPGEAEASSRFGLYVRRWGRWTWAEMAVADIPARNGVVAG